jgi:hypothetical protein
MTNDEQSSLRGFVIRHPSFPKVTLPGLPVSARAGSMKKPAVSGHQP